MQEDQSAKTPAPREIIEGETQHMSNDDSYKWSLRVMGSFAGRLHSLSFKRPRREEALLAVPVIIEEMRSHSTPGASQWERARDAATALGELRDPSSVPTLIEVLAAPYSLLARVEWEVLRALGKIGGPSAPAVPLLTKRLYKNAYVVPVLAAQALYRIGTPEAIGALEELSFKAEMAKRFDFDFRVNQTAVEVARAALGFGEEMPDVDHYVTFFG